MQLAYKDRATWLHKVDPITKFIWVCLVNLALLSTRGLLDVLCINLMALLTSWALGNIDLKRYVSVSLILLIGGSLIIIYQMIFQPSGGLNIGGIEFSLQGFYLGLAIALRVLGIVAVAQAFSETTKPSDVYLSMIKLKMPYKMARMVYISLRFIPVFERDLEDIKNAQKLRGIEHNLRNAQGVLLTLIGAEYRKVDEISIALETRGFGLNETRTEMEDLDISASGITLNIITFLVILVIKL